MEKVMWRQVKHNDKAGSLPNLRWGHCCCLIEDEVVFFGGYADSNYMNDVWSFNTITMEWSQIETKGDVPSHRSNCTMNYDKENHRVIVFGGGGANKKRFNAINILDWKTKEWIEINPKTSDPAPWERTYHTAELFYPYLVVYGGEGVSDLDDLWIFNFISMDWKEVHLPENTVRPCARRFHSSAKVGSQFYVIAGCHSKYRCLSDIYSIDLKSFFETGSMEGLAWRERKMRDNTFLTRWGHTSAVYQDKIYVFGGRFCNDLNDILVLDPSRDQITSLKVIGQIPKARRRHSACFLGSSMLIFGGFNGQYFNDLHYVNMTSSKKKISYNFNVNEQNIGELRKMRGLQWQSIKSIDGKDLSICKGLVIGRFQSLQSFETFLSGVNEELSGQQLQNLILSLYKGYGKLNKNIIYKYGLNIYESKQEMEGQLRRNIDIEQRESIILKKSKFIDPVIVLDDEHFRQYIQKKRNQQKYYDVVFNLNNEALIKTNRALLSINSSYFRCLLSNSYIQNASIINVPFNDVILFESMVNYLTTGFLVTSQQYGHEYWAMLAEMAEYYSISNLTAICENQLLSRTCDSTCHELLIVGLQMNLNQLSKLCAEQIIRSMVNQQKEEINDLFPEIKNEEISLLREKALKEVYGMLRFDILQKKIDSEQKEGKNSLKSIDSSNNQNTSDEKQNFQIKG